MYVMRLNMCRVTKLNIFKKNIVYTYLLLLMSQFVIQFIWSYKNKQVIHYTELRETIVRT